MLSFHGPHAEVSLQFNPFWTAKVAAKPDSNGNHRLFLKSKP